MLFPELASRQLKKISVHQQSRKSPAPQPAFDHHLSLSFMQVCEPMPCLEQNHWVTLAFVFPSIIKAGGQKHLSPSLSSVGSKLLHWMRNMKSSLRLLPVVCRLNVDVQLRLACVNSMKFFSRHRRFPFLIDQYPFYSVELAWHWKCIRQFINPQLCRKTTFADHILWLGL